MPASEATANLRIAVIGLSGEEVDWTAKLAGRGVEVVLIHDVRALATADVQLGVVFATPDRVAELVPQIASHPYPFAVFVDRGVAADQAYQVSLLKILLSGKREWEKTFDAILDPIMVLNGSGAVIRANLQLARVLGRTIQDVHGEHYSALLGPPVSGTGDRFPQEAVDPVAQTLADGQPRQAEARYGKLAGMHEITVSPLGDQPGEGLVVILKDVSERRDHQERMQRANRLADVGQLAAGIAHEINTPIQFIGDNVRFLGDAFGELALALDGDGGAQVAPAPDLAFLTVEVPLAVEQTLEGVERVATIVKAMKAIGHPSTENKTYADLNQAIRNTLVVAVSEIKYVADVDTELGDLPPVWCHPGDVNQVLLNLVVNAAHAIREKVGGKGERGTITVRTFPDGDDAIIEVTDTGVGITPDVGEHIFEPFFTTKEVGVGTGQGLALVYSLVTDRHRGSIGFVSEPGAGTTFTVRLPTVAPALAATP